MAIVTHRLVSHIDSGKQSLNDVVQNLLSELLVTAQAGQINVLAEFGDVLADSRSELAAKLELASIFARSLKSGNNLQSDVQRQLGPLYQQAVGLIRDPEQPEGRRCSAMSLIGIGIAPEDRERELLVSLLSPNTPAEVQKQAIDCLTQNQDPSASGDLFDRWPAMSQSVRDHCVGRMLMRRSWSESLLGALESGRIAVSDLTAAARQQLVKSGTRSMRVRAERLVSVSGSIEKRELVQSYLSQLQSKRDSANGAALFKKHCAVCHVPDSEGRATGASLANLSDRSDRALVEAILDPNRAVEPKYQSYIIQTTDDRILAGAIEEEAGSSITLAHADGKRTTIHRSEIASMKNSGVSLMPEGFQEILPPEAVQDLIRYIQDGAASK